MALIKVRTYKSAEGITSETCK